MKSAIPAIFLLITFAMATSPFLPSEVLQTISDSSSLSTNYIPRWYDCGFGMLPFKIINLTLSHNPSRYVNYTATTCGSINENIEIVSIEVETTCNGNQITNQTIIVDDNVVNGDSYCFNTNHRIPLFAPAGVYNVTNYFLSNTTAILGCVKYTFNVSVV